MPNSFRYPTCSPVRRLARATSSALLACWLSPLLSACDATDGAPTSVSDAGDISDAAWMDDVCNTADATVGFDAPDAADAPDATDAPDAGDAIDTGDTIDAGDGIDAGDTIDAGDAALPPDEGECPRPETSLASRSAAELFEADHLPTFDFYLPPERWEELQRNARDEQYVEAVACFEGRRVGTVGLRFKGSIGTLRNCFDAQDVLVCPKLSMKVKFDKYESSLRFHGLKRLNFHSMNNDRSHLRDRLSYRLYREMGIIAPRSAFAVLRVNGDTQGLFAMVEDIDGRFTDDRFPKNGDGDLYKEAWPTTSYLPYYANRLETNSETATHEVPVALGKALASASGPSEARTELGRFIDLSYFYRYMAVDDAIRNIDGVTAFYPNAASAESRNHNFYFYVEEKAPKLWLIPWDLDNTWAFTSFDSVPHWTERPADCTSLYPVWTSSYVSAPGCNVMFSALAADLSEYRAAIDELLDGPMAEDVLLASIDRDAELLRPAVDADPYGPGADTFEVEVARLKNLIPLLRERLRSLRDGESIIGFFLNADARNGFEGNGTFQRTMTANLRASSGTEASAYLTKENALSGARHVRVDFSFANNLTAWDQWVHLSLPFRDSRVDARSYTGIRVWARSNRPRSVLLGLESPHRVATSSGSRFRWDLRVDQDARAFELRFADAQIPGWVASEGLDPQEQRAAVLETLSALVFTPVCAGRDSNGFLPEGVRDTGWLDIDDIELF